MNTQTLSGALGATAYPGRGILIGKSADGKRAFLAYFIMGRSVNSRNRIFVEDGEGIRTQAFDPSKMQDPSLIIYAPVRVLGNRIIVTNGDQTDTVYEALAKGEDFRTALRRRTFEPDAPNYTPRISALVTLENGDFTLEMSVLKCADDCGGSAMRCFYELESLAPGTGWFIHTYAGDGNPLPSFRIDPEKVTLGDDFADFTETVWQSLNEDNRVSLWTAQVDLAGGAREIRITNANR